MKKLLMGCVLLCFITTGCASLVNKKMDSWVGHDVNDLIASWGAPQQSRSDGSGGEILIYTNDVKWTTPGKSTTKTTGHANTYGNINTNTYGNYSANTYGNAQSRTTYTPPQTHGYQRQRMFWVNSSGKIYRWSWKGL